MGGASGHLVLGQIATARTDLLPWIRTELIRISGSGGEEDGQEQAYGSADHRCAEAGRGRAHSG
jgi:hypothetical protein